MEMVVVQCEQPRQQTADLSSWLRQLWAPLPGCTEGHAGLQSPTWVDIIKFRMTYMSPFLECIIGSESAFHGRVGFETWLPVDWQANGGRVPEKWYWWGCVLQQRHLVIFTWLVVIENYHEWSLRSQENMLLMARLKVFATETPGHFFTRLFLIENCHE